MYKFWAIPLPIFFVQFNISQNEWTQKFETLLLNNYYNIFKSIIGNQIPISPSPSVVFLFPSIRMREFYSEVNFGDDPAKPFEYDIRNCPGLGLACI
jgi:hypothetical protein